MTCLPLCGDFSMQWLHVEIACVVSHTPGEKLYDQFYARPSSDCSRDLSKPWTLYQAQCISCKKDQRVRLAGSASALSPAAISGQVHVQTVFADMHWNLHSKVHDLHLTMLYAPVHMYMHKQGCTFDTKTCMTSIMTRQEFTMLFFVPELVHALFCCHYSGCVCVCVCVCMCMHVCVQACTQTCPPH